MLTGIIRRMDDLGRIAIPKEIRRRMGVLSKDCPAFEISYYHKSKSIVLTPFSPEEDEDDCFEPGRPINSMFESNP